MSVHKFNNGLLIANILSILAKPRMFWIRALIYLSKADIFDCQFSTVGLLKPILNFPAQVIFPTLMFISY